MIMDKSCCHEKYFNDTTCPGSNGLVPIRRIEKTNQMISLHEMTMSLIKDTMKESIYEAKYDDTSNRVMIDELQQRIKNHTGNHNGHDMGHHIYHDEHDMENDLELDLKNDIEYGLGYDINHDMEHDVKHDKENDIKNGVEHDIDHDMERDIKNDLEYIMADGEEDEDDEEDGIEDDSEDVGSDSTDNSLGSSSSNSSGFLMDDETTNYVEKHLRLEDPISMSYENMKFKEQKKKVNEETEEDKDLWWANIDGYTDIQKQIIEAGEETLDKPKDGDACTVNLIGTLERSTVVDKFINHIVHVGDRDISEGVDIILKTMCLNECARAKVASQYLHDKNGRRSDIPFDMPVYYMIRLLKIEKRVKEDKLRYRKDFRSLVMNERMLMRRFVDRHIVDQNGKKGEEEKWYDEIDLDAFAISRDETFHKIAIAELIMKDYIGALTTVNHVLKYDEDNTMALFLRDIISNQTEFNRLIIKIFASSSKLPLPESAYPKIKDIKNIAMKMDNPKKRRRSAINKRTLSIVGIGGTFILLGAAITKLAF